MMMLKRHRRSLPSLPDDIITNIFALLPVKSIFRFRSVSKTWYSQLSNPNFIKLYYSNSIRLDKFSLILAIDSRLYCVDSDSVLSDEPRLNIIDYPSFYLRYNRPTLGSCNGLICYSYNHKTYLFNPSTYEYKLLPPPQPPFELLIEKLVVYKCSSGFGYDFKLDDYKFILLSRILNGRDVYTKPIIYSLRSDSWKSIDKIPYELISGSCGVFVNGALHWKATSCETSCDVIVSFDMVDEKFEELPIPNDLNVRSSSFLSDTTMVVGVLGEYLSVFDNVSGFQTQVWVMNEYGVSGSWTKLLSITTDNVIALLFVMKPIKSFNNGYILLANLFDYVLYDQKKKKDTILKIRANTMCSKAVACVRSLVSLDSNTYLKQESYKDKQ